MAINEEGVTGGAAGELDAAASSQSDAELLSALEGRSGEAAAPSADDDFYAKLRGMDPNKLPDDIRSKFELPFLKQYTKQTTEFSNKQQALLDAVTRQLSDKGVVQTPDERAELMERIRGGDFDAIGQYIQRSVNDQIGPMVTENARDRAIQRAYELNPFVKEREAEISQMIQSDPELQMLVRADNFRYAPKILAGIALQIENQALKQNQEQRITAEVEKRITALKARAAGLPKTTSRAGTTQSGSQGKTEMTIREAMRAAAAEAGMELPD